MARAKPPSDLAELDKVQKFQDEGIVVPILNVDLNSPLGFSIRIAGPDSERRAEANELMQAEIVGLGHEPNRAEAIRLENTLLARLSIEFVGSAKMDGRILDSKESDFLALYQRFRFIRNQIDRAQARRADFLPESLNSLSTESGGSLAEK